MIITDGQKITLNMKVKDNYHLEIYLKQYIKTFILDFNYDENIPFLWNMKRTHKSYKTFIV